MFTKRRIVLIILALAWAGVVVVGASYRFGRPRPVNDVTARLGRGGLFMNLLLPAQANRDARMISVYTDGQVIYWSPQTTGVYAQVSMKVPVTLTEWQAVDALRRQWCQTAPQSPPASTGTLVYDVGWLGPGGMFGQQAQIPATLAPPALMTLIERIPPE